MQLNRFDLNLLIALDALLHEKNVTRAAERVFIPPAHPERPVRIFEWWRR